MESSTIIVGAVGPLSGRQENYGAQIERGVAHAVQHLNSAGGLLNKRLVLRLEDDKGIPKHAPTAASAIVASGASVVIGHYLSDCSSAAAGTYARASVIQIAPSSTNPQFTDQSANNGWTTVFRTCGRDDKQGIVAADYIMREYSSAKIGILHNNLPYGIELTRVVRERLTELGITQRLNSSFDTSINSMTSVASCLKKANCDFVYIGAYYTETGPFIRFLRDAGFRGHFMTGGANANRHLYDLAGKASDGLLMTCRPNPCNAANAQPAVNALRASSFEPEGYTLSAVAAVEVWSQAVERCGTTNSIEVAKALRAYEFSSSYGDISFDAKGDVRNPLYAIHAWSNGDYHEID